MKIEASSAFFLIFLTLFVLKLCSVIAISWWIVTLPLWFPACIGLFIIFFVLVIAGIAIWRKS
jgi:hypothetical protein